jgi:hypothetical protein
MVSSGLKRCVGRPGDRFSEMRAPKAAGPRGTTRGELGAPRWNIVVQGERAEPYTLFLGCAAATPTFPHPGWTKDSYTGDAILTVGATNSGNLENLEDIQGSTIVALYILFDEGTTLDGEPSDLGSSIWTTSP